MSGPEIAFQALPTQAVAALQSGGRDAYGMMPEQRISDGCDVPCRHCLRLIGAGEAYIVAAFRPFVSLQPYAETGPIFLHASRCERAHDSACHPEILTSPAYLLRGYDDDERIVGGTGGIVSIEDLPDRARCLLARDDIAFVDVRSAAHNCFQCRIARAVVAT